MKKALALLIMAVMIVIGIYAIGIAENDVEADVLPEIAFLSGDAGIVLDNAISTHFEFKIYDLESETVVAAGSSIYESDDRFKSDLRLAVTDRQESFDWYLSDLRMRVVNREGYYADNNVETVYIGNIQTAGLILRL